MAAIDDAIRADAAAWLACLRGNPDSSALAAFEAWYVKSEAHAAAYDAILESWDRSHQLMLADRPEFAVPLRWYHRASLRIAIAATLLLLACAALALLRHPDDGIRRSHVEPIPTSAPSRLMALADGSTVTLEAGAIIRTAFTPTERRIFLDHGRARFDVAHHEDRPFVVEAAGARIIAHGTIFDVTEAHESALVALLRGSIEIQRPVHDPHHPRDTRMLAPGQQTLVTFRGFTRIEAIPPAQSDWPRGMLSFDDALLRDVVRAANRTGLPQLLLTDDAASRLRFTGTVRVGRADELAAMIGSMFDLAISRDATGNYLATTRTKKLPGD